MQSSHERNPEASSASTVTDPSLWQELIAICRATHSMSRDLAVQLQQGAPAHTLIPLLKSEAALAARLRTGIAQFAQQRLSPNFAERHTELLEQVKRLLTQEQENHRTMSRRGVKLSGSRSPRNATYRPQLSLTESL